MNNEWFISDMHFGDKAVLTPGKNPRPFGSLNEMADTIIDNWRALVAEDDVVWVLGDLGRDLEPYRDVPGRLRLIAGNNDGNTLRLADLFEEVHGCKYLKGLVLTHIPVHVCQVGKWLANVHGHLHGRTVPHDRFLSVCVDQTQWRPISRAKVDWALRVPVDQRYPLRLPGTRERSRSAAQVVLQA